MTFKVGDHDFEGEESSCPGKIIDFYTNSNVFLGIAETSGMLKVATAFRTSNFLPRLQEHDDNAT
jgi:hypothetical protein